MYLIIDIRYNCNGGVDCESKNNISMYRVQTKKLQHKKNKKNNPDRIEMKKYCRFCKKHTPHKETKYIA